MCCLTVAGGCDVERKLSIQKEEEQEVQQQALLSTLALMCLVVVDTTNSIAIWANSMMTRGFCSK